MKNVKNIHPVRRFVDKRTENTLKLWFHEKIVVLTMALKEKIL